MNLLHIYLIVSTLLAFFVFTIWTKAGWVNVLIKFTCLLIGQFGLLEIFTQRVFNL